jgi:hypothetical protein
MQSSLTCARLNHKSKLLPNAELRTNPCEYSDNLADKARGGNTLPLDVVFNGTEVGSGITEQRLAAAALLSNNSQRLEGGPLKPAFGLSGIVSNHCRNHRLATNQAPRRGPPASAVFALAGVIGRKVKVAGNIAASPTRKRETGTVLSSPLNSEISRNSLNRHTI